MEVTFLMSIPNSDFFKACFFLKACFFRGVRGRDTETSISCLLYAPRLGSNWQSFGAWDNTQPSHISQGSNSNFIKLLEKLTY